MREASRTITASLLQLRSFLVPRQPLPLQCLVPFAATPPYTRSYFWLKNAIKYSLVSVVLVVTLSLDAVPVRRIRSTTPPICNITSIVVVIWII